MSLVVFGANGQVGRALLEAFKGRSVIGTVRPSHQTSAPHLAAVDLADAEQVITLLNQVQPTQVINAAADTAVEQAEERRAQAFRINGEAPGLIAQWCAQQRAQFIHYSTDYVFNGQQQRPYQPEDPVAPLGVYGQSKLAGENAVRQAGGQWLIFRTAWVYASDGKNFMRTMLRLAAQHARIRIVADQIGTPTPAWLIAQVTKHVLDRGYPPGIRHLTAQGQTSWAGFAREIFMLAHAQGLLPSLPEIEEISAAAYPSAVRRPAYSVLDTESLVRDFQVTLPSWQDGLRQVMQQLTAIPD